MSKRKNDFNMIDETVPWACRSRANEDKPAEPILPPGPFGETVRQATAGDPEAQAKLRKQLDESPETWSMLGDLGRHAELALVRAIADGNALVTESIHCYARNLRLSLGIESASPLERIAIERVVASLLQLQHIDVAAAPDSISFEHALVTNRRQDSAQRRLDATMRMLLLVRHAEQAMATAKGKASNASAIATEQMAPASGSAPTASSALAQDGTATAPQDGGPQGSRNGKPVASTRRSSRRKSQSSTNGRFVSAEPVPVAVSAAADEPVCTGTVADPPTTQVPPTCDQPHVNGHAANGKRPNGHAWANRLTPHLTTPLLTPSEQV